MVGQGPKQWISESPIHGVRNCCTQHAASGSAEVGIANAVDVAELGLNRGAGDLITKKKLQLIGAGEGGLNGSTVTILDNLCQRCHFCDDWLPVIRLLAEVKTEVRFKKVEEDLINHKDDSKARFDNMQMQVDEMRNSIHNEIAKPYMV